MNQKFLAGKTYFVESLGDPASIPPDIFQQILDHLATFPKTIFMLQSKNPIYFKDFEYTENIWLGTTIETNLYKVAQCYSKAPDVVIRYHGLFRTQKKHSELHYYLTYEPIMTCQALEMLDIATGFPVDAVYIGRDNWKHKLPEPSEQELMELVELLRQKLGKENVHCKTLGPAWYELE